MSSAIIDCTAKPPTATCAKSKKYVCRRHGDISRYGEEQCRIHSTQEAKDAVARKYISNEELIGKLKSAGRRF